MEKLMSANVDVGEKYTYIMREKSDRQCFMAIFISTIWKQKPYLKCIYNGSIYIYLLYNCLLKIVFKYLIKIFVVYQMDSVDFKSHIYVNPLKKILFNI